MYGSLADLVSPRTQRDSRFRTTVTYPISTLYKTFAPHNNQSLSVSRRRNKETEKKSFEKKVSKFNFFLFPPILIFLVHCSIKKKRKKNVLVFSYTQRAEPLSWFSWCVFQVDSVDGREAFCSNSDFRLCYSNDDESDEQSARAYHPSERVGCVGSHRCGFMLLLMGLPFCLGEANFRAQKKERKEQANKQSHRRGKREKKNQLSVEWKLGCRVMASWLHLLCFVLAGRIFFSVTIMMVNRRSAPHDSVAVDSFFSMSCYSIVCTSLRMNEILKIFQSSLDSLSRVTKQTQRPVRHNNKHKNIRKSRSSIGVGISKRDFKLRQAEN